MKLKNKAFSRFPELLIQWFREYQRVLPWRSDPQAYHVWVSEMMLQQTKVRTVLPYYDRFIARFPTCDSLAASDLQEVLTYWKGLGYYRRAHHLHEGAKRVVQDFHGVVPSNLEVLVTLPGIGAYTAAAIASIAYGVAVPVVDGNVMRVMARLLAIEDDIRSASTIMMVRKILEQMIPPRQPSDFNQGMMELGAMICIPSNPNCSQCPLVSLCQAHRLGRQLELPLRAPDPKQREVIHVVLLWEDQEGKFAVRRRPSEGLLPSMWEFPGFDVEQWENVESSYQASHTIPWNCWHQVLSYEHVFSHIRWKVHVFRQDVPVANHDANLRYVALQQMKDYAIPTAFQPILQWLGQC